MKATRANKGLVVEAGEMGNIVNDLRPGKFASFGDVLRDNLAKVFSNRAQGRIETRVVARKLYQDWQRYAGQKRDPVTKKDLAPNPENFLDFVHARYQLDGQTLDYLKNGLTTPHTSTDEVDDEPSSTEVASSPPSPDNTIQPDVSFNDSRGNAVAIGDNVKMYQRQRVRVVSYDKKTDLVTIQFTSNKNPQPEKTSYRLNHADKFRKLLYVSGGSGKPLFNDETGKSVYADSKVDIFLPKSGIVKDYDDKLKLVKIFWPSKNQVTSIRIDHLLKNNVVKESRKRTGLALLEDAATSSLMQPSPLKKELKGKELGTFLIKLAAMLIGMNKVEITDKRPWFKGFFDHGKGHHKGGKDIPGVHAKPGNASSFSAPPRNNNDIADMSVFNADQKVKKRILQTITPAMRRAVQREQKPDQIEDSPEFNSPEATKAMKKAMAFYLTNLRSHPDFTA